ncbi:MAG: phosphomethylpyrimidine synthase ThiC [Verrucomicrobiota bacterium]
MIKSKYSTQTAKAKAGIITPQMRQVATAELLPPERIRELVAQGAVIIPANLHHSNLEAMGIGSELRTKVNANIGNSSLSSNADEELRKLRTATSYGADTVMDLSTGSDLEEIRSTIIANSKVPLGTVPIYEAVCRVEEPEDITAELVLEVIEEQALQGVDYMTIHAGILFDHIELADNRRLGIVSRGGGILAKWMKENRSENPFYTHFPKILEICRRHDVSLSLGDGLRPGCLADASDEAQFAELKVLGELVKQCREADVQCMVEGPGHIPLNEIAMNMAREAELCANAPFYVLGPVVTDCAPGYDHISGAIGGALGAYHGAAMLCYVTPKEHLGLPEEEDVRQGVIAFCLAAHAADVARGRPAARDRDDEISTARANFDWEKQFQLALDPERARELREASLKAGGGAEKDSNSTNTPEYTDENDDNYCTMCGPKFCPMRLRKS